MPCGSCLARRGDGWAPGSSRGEGPRSCSSSCLRKRAPIGWREGVDSRLRGSDGKRGRE